MLLSSEMEEDTVAAADVLCISARANSLLPRNWRVVVPEEAPPEEEDLLDKGHSHWATRPLHKQEPPR